MLVALMKRRAGSWAAAIACTTLLVQCGVFVGSVAGADKTANEPEPSAAKDIAVKAKADQTATSGNAAKSGDVAKSTKPGDSSVKSDKGDKTGKPATIGDPLAANKMQLLKEEILSGVRQRGIEGNLARFQSYADGRLDASAGRYTGSELAGNCRLHWYESMMRHLIAVPAAAEQFTRELHTAVCDEHEGLAKTLSIIAEKLDLGNRKPYRAAPVASPEQAMEVLKQALIEAQTAYAAALAPLEKAEIRDLQGYLVPVFCLQNQVGHTLSDRNSGRRLCDLIEKMNRVSLLAAAESADSPERSAPARATQSVALRRRRRRAGRYGPGSGQDRYPRRLDRRWRQGEEHLSAR